MVQKTESSKEFINAFFFHQAAEIKEMNHLSSPVARVVGILPEIYTGTGQNFDLSGSSNSLFQKQMGICTIFKEDNGGFFQCISIECRYPFFNRFFLKSGAKPLDIGTIRNIQNPAEEAGINIRLDGIRNDQIRFFLSKKTQIINE